MLSMSVLSIQGLCYKETQWEAGRHKQELEQETMKSTRTGE